MLQTFNSRYQLSTRIHFTKVAVPALDFNFLLQLSSFLDPRFKLNYVSARAEVMEEIERQMRGLIEPDSSSVGGASHLPSSLQPGSLQLSVFVCNKCNSGAGL